MTIKIIKFKHSDIKEIVSLFYGTVHSVNAQHYTQAQLDAWAPKGEQAHKEQSWLDSFHNHISFVARIDGILVGFIDMTMYGYLDRLYVHKDFQGQGVASALVSTIESEAKKLGLAEINTEASITAKHFFKNRGYQLVQTQKVERKGVTLVNFKMINLLNSASYYRDNRSKNM